jgi:hypothetical protein
MKWRYGIVKFRHPANKDLRFYGVGELYFMDDPLKVFACSEEPVQPYVEDDEEEIMQSIINQLEMIQKDIAQFPIFDADGPFEKYPIDESMEEWVEMTDEKLDEMFGKEDYAGHVDEVGLAEYIKSIQEEQGE